MLERQPTLRLNLGHVGHDYGVANPTAPRETTDAWIYQTAGLMDRHPNVYADLSNSPLVYGAEYARRLVPLLADVIARHPIVKHRLMYGSAWWLSAVDPNATFAIERFRAALGAPLGPAWVADLMGRNALRFLRISRRWL